MSIAPQMTRRSALKLAGAGALAVVAAGAPGRLTRAQEGTPAAGAGGEAFADLGLPELTITITEDSFAGLESEVSPGTYLVHATSEASQPSFLTFMQLPEGMTSSDLLALLSGNAEGTPVAEGEEILVAPPEWFYTTHIAGGAGVGPGQTVHFVIALQPGNYVVWGEDPTAPQAPVDLSVAGDPAAAGATPAADVTILEVVTEDGFAFEYDGDFVAGTQVVAVTNNSDQPHFVEIDLLPDGTTSEDIDALFSE